MSELTFPTFPFPVEPDGEDSFFEPLGFVVFFSVFFYPRNAKHERVF